MAELEDKPSSDVCEAFAFDRTEHVTSARGRFFELVRTQIARLRCAGCADVTYGRQENDASFEEKFPVKPRETSMPVKQSCIPEEGRQAKLQHNKLKVKLSSPKVTSNKPKLCLSESETIHKPVSETSKQRSESPENVVSQKRVDVVSKHRISDGIVADSTVPDARLRQVSSSPPLQQVSARSDNTNSQPQNTHDQHSKAQAGSAGSDANFGPTKGTQSGSTALDQVSSEACSPALSDVNVAINNADNESVEINIADLTTNGTPISHVSVDSYADQENMPSVSDTDPRRTYRPRRRHHFFWQPYEGGYFSYFGEQESQSRSPPCLTQLAGEAHDKLRKTRRRRHWFYQENFSPAFSVYVDS